MKEHSHEITVDGVVCEVEYREATLRIEFSAGAHAATAESLMLLFSCEENEPATAMRPYHIELRQPGGVTLSGGSVQNLEIVGLEFTMEWQPGIRQTGVTAADIAGLERHRLRVLLPWRTPVLNILAQMIATRATEA